MAARGTSSTRRPWGLPHARRGQPVHGRWGCSTARGPRTGQNGQIRSSRAGTGRERPMMVLGGAGTVAATEAGPALRVALGEDDVLLREGIARILTDAGL